MSEFPISKTDEKQVRSFLCMAIYYRKFITDFAQNACYALKQKPINNSVLVYPDSSKPFVLTCGAFDTAIGYVLGQVNDDNQEWLLLMIVRHLPYIKRNLTLTKECCFDSN